jgi:DNA polymerase-3 subunit alpha
MRFFRFAGISRAEAMETMGRVLNGGSKQAARLAGQQSIFGEPSGGEIEAIAEWGEEEILKAEKEALGFYITGHPLTRYREQLQRMGTARRIAR